MAIACSAHPAARCLWPWLFLILLPWTAWAAEDDDKAARLEALRQQIQTLRQALNEDRGQQRVLRQRLQRAEKEIGRLSRSLRETRARLSQRRQALADLRRRRDVKQRELERHRDLLRRQVVAAYAMGRQGDLKIILNQQDPAAIGRALTYYDYFNRARAEQIAVIRRHLQAVADLETEIDRETRRLERLSRRQARQMAEKETRLAERRQVLAKLEEAIRTKEQRLQAYLEDERRLARLLDQIQEALTDIPSEEGDMLPFAALKGRLVLPVQGRVSARFGQRRLRSGRLKWQGVLLSAPEGAAVRSIHHGRVAFADWLRGFGLLIIIDHGGGYMSLYAHNQSLYKSVGEWVSAGEIIATVGSSGGRKQPGLYFEIRHNGKPVDPLRWCRRESRPG